jgi:UDP-N-acetylmuramate--alanine ligase
LPAFDGRRFWFVGIGGAGLSGYALLAQAWGAEVAGWDRYETPYLGSVRAAGIPVTICADVVPAPEGWEAVVSTAFAGRAEGRSRSDFLAELVSPARAIVVAGAHGKTTTAAMIAFVLDRLGLDPAYLIGAEVPQLGGNAAAGSGWLVVEGDESDRTVFALPAEIAVITNLDLDHHTTFASEAELAEAFSAWAGGLIPGQVVWGHKLDPVDFELAVPGEHNRLNAACALAALELAGVSREDAIAALREFRGAGRRLEPRGEAGGVRLFDDYAHHPAEVAATLAAARELGEGGRRLVLFQPHLYSRTLHLAAELGAALAQADVVSVLDVYPAREDPIEGVSGKLVVDAVCEARPGMTVAWTPDLEDGAAFLAGRARPGDVLLTIGAGDVEKAVPLIAEKLGS